MKDLSITLPLHWTIQQFSFSVEELLLLGDF
jgi:hypothetical protein